MGDGWCGQGDPFPGRVIWKQLSDLNKDPLDFPLLPPLAPSVPPDLEGDSLGEVTFSGGAHVAAWTRGLRGLRAGHQRRPWACAPAPGEPVSWWVLAPPPAATWGPSCWTGRWRDHCGVGVQRAGRGCAGCADVGARPGHPQWPPWGRRRVRGGESHRPAGGSLGDGSGPPAGGGSQGGRRGAGQSPRGGPPRLSAPGGCHRQVEPRWSSGRVQPVHHAGQRPGRPQEAPYTLVCDNYTKLPGLGAETMWGAPESAMQDSEQEGGARPRLQGQEAGALREAQGTCPRGSAGPARGPRSFRGSLGTPAGHPPLTVSLTIAVSRAPRPAGPTPAQDKSPGGRGGRAAGTRAHTCPPPRGLRAENFTFRSEAAEAGGEDASGGHSLGGTPRESWAVQLRRGPRG